MMASTRSGQTTVGDIERNRERDLPRRSAKDDASAAASVVFVVDDDASLRDSLRRLITSVGFKVEVFPSARAFLDAHAKTILAADFSMSVFLRRLYVSVLHRARHLAGTPGRDHGSPDGGSG